MFFFGAAISGMTVLPEYQRSGAGSVFIQWGLERADAVGAVVGLYDCQ